MHMPASSFLHPRAHTVRPQSKCLEHGLVEYLRNLTPILLYERAEYADAPLLVVALAVSPSALPCIARAWTPLVDGEEFLA